MMFSLVLFLSLTTTIIVLNDASPIEDVLYADSRESYEDYDAELGSEESLSRVAREGWFLDDYGNYLWEDSYGNVNTNSGNGNNNNGDFNGNVGSNFGNGNNNNGDFNSNTNIVGNNNGNNNSGDNNGNVIHINCHRRLGGRQFNSQGSCVCNCGGWKK